MEEPFSNDHARPVPFHDFEGTGREKREDNK